MSEFRTEFESWKTEGDAILGRIAKSRSALARSRTINALDYLYTEFFAQLAHNDTELLNWGNNNGLISSFEFHQYKE